MIDVLLDNSGGTWGQAFHRASLLTTGTWVPELLGDSFCECTLVGTGLLRQATNLPPYQEEGPTHR